VPIDSNVKKIIDKLAVYVSEDGHLFEEELLRKDIKDIPGLSFLKNKLSDEAHYYRWKVFSLLTGSNELPRNQIFQGGAEWILTEDLTKRYIK